MDKAMTKETKLWTGKEIILLRQLVEQGKSASEIAKELGGRTRNSVIGAMHRNKIASKLQPIGRPREKSQLQPRIKREPRIKMARLFMSDKKEEKQDHVKLPETPPSRESYVPFLDRRYNQCKYIVEKRGDAYYCCGGAVDKLGWCAFHASIVYRPIDPKPVNRDGNGPDKKIPRPSE